MGQQLLKIFFFTDLSPNDEKVEKSNLYESRIQDIAGLYLVRLNRITMFISIDHSQGDRQSISNEGDCYCVSSNGRESVDGRKLRPWKAERWTNE